MDGYIPSQILPEDSNIKSSINSSAVSSSFQNIINDSSSYKTTNASITDEKWNYIDPSGIPRGPFLATQLHVWYKSGYFNSTLALYREGEQNTITLGKFYKILH